MFPCGFKQNSQVACLLSLYFVEIITRESWVRIKVGWRSHWSKNYPKCSFSNSFFATYLSTWLMICDYFLILAGLKCKSCMSCLYLMPSRVSLELFLPWPYGWGSFAMLKNGAVRWVSSQNNQTHTSCLPLEIMAKPSKLDWSPCSPHQQVHSRYFLQGSMKFILFHWKVIICYTSLDVFQHINAKSLLWLWLYTVCKIYETIVVRQNLYTYAVMPETHFIIARSLLSKQGMPIEQGERVPHFPKIRQIHRN